MRPEILFPLFSPVSTLKGVGPKVEPLVQKLAGPLVRDMLFLGPQSLVHRTPTTVDSVVDGQVHTLIVDIEQHTKPPRMDVPYKIRAFDGTAFLTLIWFRGHGEHLLRSHPVGSRRVVSGKIERWGNEIQMAHPDYIVAVEKAADVPEVEAVYPATAGLPARTVRKLAHEALTRAPDLTEWQDPAWLAREGLPPWREALEAFHNPATESDLSPLSPARQRLAWGCRLWEPLESWPAHVRQPSCRR
jgi:ATP-dependent DNA helicase RecG